MSDEIPKRPKLTARILLALVPDPGCPDASIGLEAGEWVKRMQSWAIYAGESRVRITELYRVHVVKAHQQVIVKMEPAEPVFWERASHCRVCAYLSEQWQAHQL